MPWLAQQHWRKTGLSPLAEGDLRKGGISLAFVLGAPLSFFRSPFGLPTAFPNLADSTNHWTTSNQTDSVWL